MDEIKLLPCPFCGVIPKMYKRASFFSVECHNLQCQVMPETTITHTKEEAAEAWNRRVNDD